MRGGRSGCFQCAAAGSISLGIAKARGFVARFFDAAARRREALLFLIAAGWKRGKPLPLYSDEWDGDVPAVSNAQRRKGALFLGAAGSGASLASLSQREQKVLLLNAAG